MPRNLHLQSKIENFIMEADRHVNAVGLSVVGSRNSDRNIQESSNAPSAGYYNSPQTFHEESPHPSQKPQSQPHDRSQNTQPFRGGNGHFPDRQNPSFPPSLGRPYAPPSHQQQLSQGTVNSSRTSPSSQQFSRVNEGAVDDFGANGPIPSPNSGRGQFGSSESSGHSLGGPVVGGLRRDSSLSESKAGPSQLQDSPTSHWQNSYQSPVQMRPPVSSEPGYPPHDPPSQGGRHHLTSEPSYSAGQKSSYSAGQPYWQNPPVIMRPPVSSESKYPPSQGGSHLNGDSYSAGPSHMQSPPIVMRPPVSSDGYPPSQGGSHPNEDSSYPVGPLHMQSPPIVMRPPVSSDGYPHSHGGSHLNDDSSYSVGPSHLQSPPVIMRQPVSSESGYPPSQGGSHPNGKSSYSAGSSHLQSSPSDRFTTPPRPSGPPESGRYTLQDPPSLGGRHHGDSSSGGYPSHDPPTSHWQNHPSDRFPMPPPPPPALPPPSDGRHGNPLHLQGPVNTGPNSPPESGGYSPQDSPLDGRHRTGSSFSETTTGASHWTPTTNRFSDVSESTTVTSEGMMRTREDPYNNQSMSSWGGSDHPNDSPPAYVLMGNPESLVPDTGPSLH